VKQTKDEIKQRISNLENLNAIDKQSIEAGDTSGSHVAEIERRQVEIDILTEKLRLRARIMKSNDRDQERC